LLPKTPKPRAIPLLNVRVSQNHSESQPPLLQLPQAEHGPLLRLLHPPSQPHRRHNPLRLQDLRPHASPQEALVRTRASTQKYQLHAARRKSQSAGLCARSGASRLAAAPSERQRHQIRRKLSSGEIGPSGGLYCRQTG